MELVKLKTKIHNSGLKKKSIAAKLGITEMSLIRKLRGDTEFKVSETIILGELLNLTNDEKCDIFFSA